MTRPVVVRWLNADGKPVDLADPQLRELIRRSVEEALRPPIGRAA
jgi:hypothetical protein